VLPSDYHRLAASAAQTPFPPTTPASRERATTSEMLQIQ
jgi:hypothetical protein